MASGHINVFTLEGGESTLASRFGLDEEPKAIAFAEELFAGSQTASIRVTMEVVDAGSGKSSSNTILIRKREEKRPPPANPARTGGKQAAAASRAKSEPESEAAPTSGPGAARTAGVVW